MAKVLLIDGAAIAYRAHYGLAGSGLSTADGKSTGATYGYATTIYKLIRDEKPDYVCVALDTDKPTYRHELYEDYKAGRPEMPDDLADQLDDMREVTEALGVTSLEVEGYEADDIIGTLASEANAKGVKVVIATGDKDLLQLVNSDTRVIMLSGAGRDTEVFNPKKVEEKYGLPPELLPDYFGLMGDSIDNVAGVPGIGEKTARALVEKHGTVDNMYANLDAIEPGRVRKLLEDGRDQAFGSLELVRIRLDVPLDKRLDDLKYEGVNTPKLTRVLKRLEFRELLRKIAPVKAVPTGSAVIWGGGGVGGLFREAAPDVEAGSAPAEFECAGRAAVAVNLKTGPGGKETLCGVAISCEGGGDYYFPLAHDDAANVTPGEFVEAAGGTLASGDAPLIVYDAKRAKVAFKNAGLEVKNMEFDALLARYLLNPGSQHNSMADLALDYAGEVWPAPSKKRQAELATLSGAACELARQARTLLEVRDALSEDLEKAALMDLYRDIEMPLVDVLADMEMRGIRVDTSMLEDLSARLDKDLYRFIKEAYSLAGREFKLNSPKELAIVLFEEIGLKPVKKTKTGYSTDVSVLTQLAAEHELPRKILEYRQVSKLKTTYVDQLLKFAEPGTGRIHAHFNQAVTATGRLSSSDPNLQNIPIRGEVGGEIRKAFVPSAPDWCFVSADYSQIELRILAHLSGEAALIEAFNRGDDIHTQTAAFVFRVDQPDVTREMRIIAKAVNFGVIYGMGAQALAKTTQLPLKEAKAFLDEHRETYPGVYEFIDATVRAAEEKGYVETLLGRRRYLPNIASSNPPLRSASERMAVNTPVQGSAADIIKLAMLRVHDRIAKAGLEGGMVIQVHDDILIDCPLAERDEMSRILEEEMGGAYELRVPLKVDMTSGGNWYETH
ncbi:MAG: DNA polymerase I [bacterium]